MKSVTVRSGRRIAYREEGAGERLVQVHGLGTGHQNFDLLTPHLSQHLHVYDLDLPGYGQSDELDQARTPDSFADSVAEFIEALSLGPVAVHGASMGGTVVISLAARYPELVDRLIISISFGRADRAAEVMRETWRAAAEYGGARALAELTSQQGFARSFWDQPGADLAKQSFVEAMETSTPAEFLRDLDAMNGIDLSDHAKAIITPTLLIGAAEDQMTPIDAAPSGIGMRDLETLIARSRLVVIDGAGHFLWFERPDAGSVPIVEFVLTQDPLSYLSTAQ